MDSKTLMDVSARRRRNNEQQLLQQERKFAVGNQGPGARNKAAGKLSSAQGKARSNLMTIAVVPPSRQRQKGNNGSGSGSGSGGSGGGGGGKARGRKHTRCTSARELQRDVQRPMQPPPPMTSRVAFGRTCPGLLSTMGTMAAPPPSSRRGNQKTRLDTPRPRPMQAAHEQLELLLTRIEQDTVMAPLRRRKPPPPKTVRRQMEHPPPVPTVTPLGSARSQTASAELNARTSSTQAGLETLVPLTQNPQLLAPEKRRTLLELLSRAEQHDQEIVNILRGEPSDAGDPSKDTMRLTLQMLPLALTPGESPYRERFWAGHRYLKERQRLHQQLQPDDLRYKEVKILRAPNGKFFLSKTLEEELKDEKHVLDFIEAELQRGQLAAMRPEQQALQQKAMNERAELDRQKQQVSEWRARHQMAEQTDPKVTKRMLKKAKQLKQQKLEQVVRSRRQNILALQMHEETEEAEEAESADFINIDNDKFQVLSIDLGSVDFQEKNQSLVDDNKHVEEDEDDDATPRPCQALGPTVELDEQLGDALMQRQQFQAQCLRSSLYGNPKCLAPWKLFTNITNTLMGQLTENIDAELHRSIANFIRDFVQNESRIAKQPN